MENWPSIYGTPNFKFFFVATMDQIKLFFERSS
jgi:hypothetical protein